MERVQQWAVLVAGLGAPIADVEGVDVSGEELVRLGESELEARLAGAGVKEAAWSWILSARDEHRWTLTVEAVKRWSPERVQYWAQRVVRLAEADMEKLRASKLTGRALVRLGESMASGTVDLQLVRQLSESLVGKLDSEGRRMRWW